MGEFIDASVALFVLIIPQGDRGRFQLSCCWRYRVNTENPVYLQAPSTQCGAKYSLLINDGCSIIN